MASSLVLGVYGLCGKFPSEEKYSLTSQLKRSANSVAANIAESCGRYYYKDKIRVLYIARGELEETRSHLNVALKLGYCSADDYKKFDESYLSLRKQLNAYVGRLRTH